MNLIRTFLFASLLNPVVSPAAESKNEAVILFHGLKRTSAHMKPLDTYLSQQGYQVFNLDYPSTKFPLEILVEQTILEVQSLELAQFNRVHFVGYSMGGILIRGILSQYQPDNLGRVIQLASPNHGSEVADFWKNNFLYRKLYGPAGQQLTTDSVYLNLLGPVTVELGIIAGNKTIDPFSSYLLPGENDGKVSVASTQLEGMKDHIVIPASHTFFPKNPITHEQVLNFLEKGEFRRGAASPQYKLMY